MSDYLGIRVKRDADDSVCLMQPHLIDSLMKDLNFAENTKGKPIPALSSIILQRDEDGPPFDEHWIYQSVIGKLNFLEKINQTRYCLCSTSVRKICYQSKSNSCGSHTPNCEISGRYIYKRDCFEANWSFFCCMGRCRFLWELEERCRQKLHCPPLKLSTFTLVSL
jgi:hypothetical protein